MERIRPPRRQHGFTLVELFVVVALLAVLAALAAPNLQSLVQRWRVLTTVHTFESSLYLARSEAIKRGGRIVIRKLPNASGCTLAATREEWGCGWEVFHDENDNGARNGTETLLQTVAPQNATNVILPQNRGGLLRIDRWGQINGLGAGRIVVSPDPAGPSSPATKALCISSGGRIRTIDGEHCD